MKKYNILGVILARGGSKGIKKKNIKPICGHPLISYSIYAGIKSKYIDKLIVSTDSSEIKNVSLSYGAEVPFLRPKKLSEDHVWSRDALKHAVLEAEKIYNEKYDYIVELPAVGPLRSSYSLDSSIKKLIRTGSDSVIGVTRVYDRHPLRIKKIKKDKIFDFYSKYKEGESSRRQALKPAYVRNGSIYAMKRETIIDQFSRVGKISRPFVMDGLESVNIDEITDLYTTEKIIQKGLCKNKPAEIYNDKKISIIKNNKNKENILVSYPKEIFINVKNKNINNYNYIFCDIKNISRIKKNKIKNIRAWIVPTNGLVKIDKKILNLFSSLKYLTSAATGFTHLDLKEIKKRKITLIKLENIKDTKNIYASSEYCLLLILATIRKLRKAIEVVNQGNWRNHEQMLRGNEISKFRFGLYGFGRIGKNIFKHLKLMSNKIHFFDPNVKKTKGIKRYKSINEFLKNTDCLVICSKLNDKNFNFFNIKTLKLLRKGSIIINISRGEIVNENHLIKLLRSKHIFSYGTDVVSNENRILRKQNPLINFSKKNDNILVSPHIGGLTFESESKALNIVMNKLYKKI